MNDRGGLGPLLTEIAACRICEAHLPHGPRPVLQAGEGAPIVIIGQAPGRRVHDSGVPWQDPSGDRLRSWLGVDTATFYDPEAFALVPMGFCFPGSGAGGDLPPRPECAPAWHDRVLAHLDDHRLTLLVGRYAQARYLPDAPSTVTEAVRSWRDHLPTLVMPHPSPRNQRWLRSNPWFDDEVVPVVRREVAARLARR